MENYDMNNDFGAFQVHQQELASILNEASKVTQVLKMSKEKELADMSEKVKNDTFKIMVTGTFKNGKSTFINAMLGEEILPAYAWPTTAVINEVKYGEQKKAILHFRNPLPEMLPEKLAPTAVRHMQKYKGQPIPPMEIPYKEIEDYVVISIDADEKQAKLQSPYAKVELFYPLELLKNGVEIIDSPGLNEDETRTKVTMEYLTKVDAILYVLDANHICAGDEMKFVEKDLRGNCMESVFFVVNRFDQISVKQQPQIRQYANMKLEAFYPEPELFCLSALCALEGRLDGNEAAISQSGILQLEKRLTEFLTKEKGKAKLSIPAKQVRHILSDEALSVIIPREYTLLDTDLEELQKKIDSIQPKIKELKRKRDQKSDEIETRIERAGRKFERIVKRRVKQLSNDVSVWVEEYQPTANIGLIPTRKKVEEVASEILDHLKRKINDEQQDWQKDVLMPEVEEEANSIFEAAEHDFSAIYAQIDEINFSMADGTYDAKTVSFWERVAGVAGGLLIGDIGLALSGGINGIGKDFARTAAIEFGSGIVLGLLGLFNPVTLVAVIIGTLLLNIGQNANRATETIKAQIAQQAADILADSADDRAAEMSEGIEKKLRAVKTQIVASISHELTDLEKQMQTVLQDKKAGESQVNARRAELKACEKEIHTLNSRLDKLIFTLLG